jgi:hypothetical protein
VRGFIVELGSLLIERAVAEVMRDGSLGTVGTASNFNGAALPRSKATRKLGSYRPRRPLQAHPLGRRTLGQAERIAHDVLGLFRDGAALTRREMLLRLGVHSSEIDGPLLQMVKFGALRKARRGPENVYRLGSPDGFTYPRREQPAANRQRPIAVGASREVCAAGKAWSAKQDPTLRLRGPAAPISFRRKFGAQPPQVDLRAPRTRPDAKRVCDCIMALLATHGELTTRELRDRLGLHAADVAYPVVKLVRIGVLRKERRGRDNVYRCVACAVVDDATHARPRS